MKLAWSCQAAVSVGWKIEGAQRSVQTHRDSDVELKHDVLRKFE